MFGGKLQQQAASLEGGGEQRTKVVGTVLVVLVIVGLVAGIMALLLRVRFTAEGEIAELADLLPVGYAFGAGMVASVNPCGFFMLPAFLSYHMAQEEQGAELQPAYQRLLRAVTLGGVATGGFIAIFALVGYVISLGGRWLIDIFPAAGFAIGIGMVLLGLWLLVTHKLIGIMAASRVSITHRKNLRNVFLFGIVYAVASLSCTLPIFLVVVGSALASEGFVDSFAQFISYALGMGSILIMVTVGAALFKGAVTGFIRGVLPHVHSVSSLFLVGAGGYIIYYWVTIGDLF